jgi:segregation and condensation protein B
MTHRSDDDMTEASAVQADTDGVDEVFEPLPPETGEARETGPGLQLEYAAPSQEPQAAEGDAEDDAEDGTPAPGELASVAQARAIIEGYLFLSNDPLSVERLSRLLNNLHPRTVRGILVELQAEYDQRGGAVQIIEVAGGFQMATRPELADWMARLQRQRRKSALTPASIETLAIIAYRQPVTRAEIEAVRGVDSGAPIRLLQDLGLVDVGGRREVPGRPQLYVTTEAFLRTFGLKSLKDLSAIPDLRRIFGEQQRLVRNAAKDTTSGAGIDAGALSEQSTAGPSEGPPASA